MAWTQNDLDNLDRAIATGATRVELPSVGVVTYRSLSEMREVRAMIQSKLNVSAGTSPIRRIKIYSVKDL